MIETSAVSIVDCLIKNAIELGASDIHLECVSDKLRVRLRIDGILYDADPIGQDVTLQVISRIKILAHMNVAEKRLPQDGKFSYNSDSYMVDLRVATFPNIYGEKIVIRVLDSVGSLQTIENLGLEENIAAAVTQIAKKHNGFFLVTGPTGSGKTTTLHALLSSISSGTKSIITLEDPVEYYRDTITQGQVSPEIGFTFERGIKSILRLDPDIIMVGEVRDRETARIAIQAALTGHLVLSTLHTNDTVGALMRLLDMGIEPFLLNAALTGILAQRLVRKLCVSCKYQANIDQADKELIEHLQLRINSMYKSKGCSDCRLTGYRGRTGIFEFLSMSSDMRTLVAKSPLIDTVYKQAHIDGIKTLASDACNKVNAGVTDIKEIYRLLV